MTENAQNHRPQGWPLAAYSPSLANKGAQHNAPSIFPQPAADEVAALGARLSAAYAAADRLELKRIKAHEADETPITFTLSNAELHVADDIEALRSMIAISQATSLGGAAVQITEVLNRIDAIADLSGNDHDMQAERAEELRAVNRLLCSVLRVLDGAADQKLADFAPLLERSNLDPRLPIAKRPRKASR